MEKVKLKHVVIKNLGVVRDGSRGSWVKVQIGRLGAIETNKLTGIITKTVHYNSFKNIGGTIECVVWVCCDKSFVSAGDIFYGDAEFSINADSMAQAIELDSLVTDMAPAYSWQFPGDRETTFTLHGVAVRVVAAAGCEVRQIQVGRMSENEKTEFEFFIRSVSPTKRPMMELVEGGKTVPGAYYPLNTYQTVVRMAAPLFPSSSVDICDLKFTYIAERDIVQAEIVQPEFQFLGEPYGVNWFDAQTENQNEVVIKPLVSFRNGSHMHVTKAAPIPEIEKIVFNEPATIIFWKDGTKSIVKARDGEPYDAEKGIAMAIAKKALGNQRDYYNTFIHWLRRYKKKLNAAPREKYVTPQLEILEDSVTEKPKKSSTKKKTTSKKGGKR